MLAKAPTNITRRVLCYRGALYQMLQNRIYRDEITHKGSAYPGQHPAIVDQDLWDRVQATLAENRVERASGTAASSPAC